MPNLPFPDGTWSFLLQPMSLLAPKNQFEPTSGKVTFQAVGPVHLMFLTVGDKPSNTVTVTYESKNAKSGLITADPDTAFTVDDHKYFFRESIEVVALDLPSGQHGAAFCPRVSVDGDNPEFVAFREESALLPPAAGDYDVSGGNHGELDYCALTIDSGGGAHVIPAAGFTRHSGPKWKNPKEVWPAKINWQLKVDGSKDILDFTGVMTVTFNFRPARVTWSFGGLVVTVRGPEEDGDWVSTAHSDPEVGNRATGSYA